MVLCVVMRININSIETQTPSSSPERRFDSRRAPTTDTRHTHTTDSVASCAFERYLFPPFPFRSIPTWLCRSKRCCFRSGDRSLGHHFQHTTINRRNDCCCLLVAPRPDSPKTVLSQVGEPRALPEVTRAFRILFLLLVDLFCFAQYAPPVHTSLADQYSCPRHCQITVVDQRWL
jgi:hypothetical protein